MLICVKTCPMGQAGGSEGVKGGMGFGIMFIFGSLYKRLDIHSIADRSTHSRGVGNINRIERCLLAV